MYKRNIREKFYEARAGCLTEQPNEKYLIQTYEKIDIIKEGKEEVKEFHYSYTVVEHCGRLYMDSIIEKLSINKKLDPYHKSPYGIL